MSIKALAENLVFEMRNQSFEDFDTQVFFLFFGNSLVSYLMVLYCYALQKDARISTHSGFKWSVAADVESLAWDPHTEHSFVVCAFISSSIS